MAKRKINRNNMIASMIVLFSAIVWLYVGYQVWLWEWEGVQMALAAALWLLVGLSLIGGLGILWWGFGIFYEWVTDEIPGEVNDEVAEEE